MNPPKEIDKDKQSLAERIGGTGQAILGEIELLAGVINADPLAQAEGEFNVEVGEIREEMEEQVDEQKP